MVLFRRLLGEVLRSQRMRQGRTLREVSADARVSLGYISEIERGQKEASSELLASLCAALDVPLSEVLSEVSDAVALEEAALAMQLEDVTLDTRSVQRSMQGSLQDAGSSDSAPRRGDVVASAA
jgi:transcriptional regulator with XRE-family HTH domain